MKFNIGDRVITTEYCADFYREGCIGTIIKMELDSKDKEIYEVCFDPNQLVDYSRPPGLEGIWWAGGEILELVKD